MVVARSNCSRMGVERRSSRIRIVIIVTTALRWLSSRLWPLTFCYWRLSFIKCHVGQTRHHIWESCTTPIMRTSIWSPWSRAPYHVTQRSKINRYNWQVDVSVEVYLSITTWPRPNDVTVNTRRTVLLLPSGRKQHRQLICFCQIRVTGRLRVLETQVQVVHDA